MNKYELNIRDYWRIIKKRWKLIILTASVFPIVTAAVTLVKLEAPVYDATAGVRVERSTNMAGLIVEVLSIPGGDPLATAGLVIKSYPVLEKVAKEEGLIPRDAAPGSVEKYGKIIADLQGRIKTEQEGNTSIINVTVSSGDPKSAERLANLVAEKYREENILLKNRQIFEAKKFIEEQLQIVQSRLKTAEETLTKYVKDQDVVSISDEEKYKLGRYSMLEAERDSINITGREYEYYLAVLRSGTAIPVKDIARPYTEGDLDKSIVARLNNKLSELILERDNLLIGLTPNHPQVKELDEKIGSVRSELMTQIEARRKTFDEKKRLVLATISNLKGELFELPPVAMEISRLEREVKINQDLYSLLRTKYQETLIKESEKVEEVSIVRRAIAPTTPVNPPQTFVNTMLGLVLGAIFGVLFAFVSESLDTSIGTIEDVESFLGSPVIGVIPKIDTVDAVDFLKERYGISGDWEIKTYQALISHFMPKSIPSECYRSLRTNVLFDVVENNVKSIMITSSSIGEGKTLTAINLSLVLAQAGRRVLVVDADFRNPSMHQYFGLDREPGLSNVILGNNAWEEVVKTMTDFMLGKIKVDDLMATPGIDNIGIITSGLKVTQPSEFLNSSRMPGLIREMEEKYDFIIFDSPPVLPVADAIILGTEVGGVFIIYEAGKTSRNSLRRTKLMLEKVGAKIRGIILNHLKPEANPDYHQSGMYYYYREGRPAESKKQNIFDRLVSLAGRFKSEKK